MMAILARVPTKKGAAVGRSFLWQRSVLAGFPDMTPALLVGKQIGIALVAVSAFEGLVEGFRHFGQNTGPG